MNSSARDITKRHLTTVLTALRKPYFANMLENRPTCILLASAAAIQMMLAGLGLPAWRCPLMWATGLHCPGCGLTRGALALLHLDFGAMLAHYSLTPLFAVGFSLVVSGAILPDLLRNRLVRAVSRIEHWTGLIWMALCIIVVYWFARW